MHNFLLSLGDTWKPDRDELRVIQEDCIKAYDRIKSSMWAQAISDPQAPRTLAREKVLGEEKRKHLVNEVLKHHPRRHIDEMWWLEADLLEEDLGNSSECVSSFFLR